MAKERERKIPVEQLREEHLQGVENESLEECSKALKAESIAVVKEMPKYERVIFRNQRDPGAPLEFHYESENVPFKMYTLIDGEAYDLPVEVIRNLERCREDINKYRRNSKGVPEIYCAGYRNHFVCERVA